MAPTQERRNDPFETDDLVRMRWDQRRLLRFFPEELVQQAATMTLSRLPEEHARHLVEDKLRVEARRLLADEDVSAPLAALEETERARQLFALMSSASPGRDTIGIVKPLRDLRNIAEKGARERDIAMAAGAGGAWT